MTIQTRKLLGLLVLIIITSITLGHFLPPTGILILPIIMVLTTGLLVFTNNKLSIFFKLLLSYCFIGLNDIGIKLFAGGIHDKEGTGWIYMLLYIGLVPCSIMLVIGLIRDKSSSILIKVFSALLFTLLIYIHLEVFEMLGVQKT